MTDPFRMTISLNVLNHLGLNLYSSVPAVVSEAVANAWDADATLVTIELDETARRIIISDDGHGMTRADINEKYLCVGYSRRSTPIGRFSPEKNRPVMGRKGIGKLSLFSIANVIEVHSVKDGERSGLILERNGIEKTIRGLESGEGSDGAGGGTYVAPEVPAEKVAITRGTKIELRELRRESWDEQALRKRLARRFSIIGDSYDFQVEVNGRKIDISERDFFKKLECVWVYGQLAPDQAAACSAVANRESRPKQIPGTQYEISGWIGTVFEPKFLKGPDGDNLNKIVVLARGKLVHEDLLGDFNDSGIYASYVIGEVNADFLDDDDKDDIATSSRQRVIEDDPRFAQLRSHVRSELKRIESAWGDLRDRHGSAEATKVEAIREWFDTLPAGRKKKARSLFGRINRLTVENPTEKQQLFKYGVLAFESLRYKENLDALEDINIENLPALALAIGSSDELEATLYHQIIKQRLSIVEKLHSKVTNDVLEKVIQKHLFDHLWLLDPSWERATAGTPSMEQNVQKEFTGLSAKLSSEEKKGRIDIKYKTAARKHIIVELKRASVKIDTPTLVSQISKYRDALRKLLDRAGKRTEPIEIVCVVGCELTDWDSPSKREESAQMLRAKGARVVLYQELIEGAYASYQAFLEKNADAARVIGLMEKIESEIIGGSGTKAAAPVGASTEGTQKKNGKAGKEGKEGKKAVPKKIGKTKKKAAPKKISKTKKKVVKTPGTSHQ